MKNAKMKILMSLHVLEALYSPVSCYEAEILKTMKLVKKVLGIKKCQAFYFYKRELFKQCSYRYEKRRVAHCHTIKQLAKERRNISDETMSNINDGIFLIYEHFS